jgi:galactokinase/mevalonate kinase-like predicted kinase
MVRSDYGGGVKLLGAGGGGFVLSFSSQSNLAKEAFNRKENRLGLKSFSPRMDSDGARVISVF